MSTKAAYAFAVDGFGYWKNAITKFKEHDKSQANRDVAPADVPLKHLPVSQELKAYFNKTQVRRRESLIKQVSALLYLLRQ